MSPESRTPPWKRKNPRKRSTKLTPEQKAFARASAQRAGRRYPNLVDNMRAAAKKTPTRKKATTKRKQATKRVKKSASNEDPHGGLSAAGRRKLARTEGAQLKPGVKKAVQDMTPQEMRRKGSWAVRFYGRKGALPPLRDAHGKPTRFALTAAAWGEPVPRTPAAARRIAAKGRALLERYAGAKAR